MGTLKLSEQKVMLRAAAAIKQVDAQLREMGLVTLTEAAKTAGVPLATASDAVRKQAIPSVKFGNQRLVRVEAIRQYFAVDSSNDDDAAEQQLLKDRGILIEMRPQGRHEFKPVKRAIVAGKPVSQSIIEDRR